MVIREASPRADTPAAFNLRGCGVPGAAAPMRVNRGDILRQLRGTSRPTLPAFTIAKPDEIRIIRRARLFLELEESDMIDVREPMLVPVPIADLRPTQITVGMREVDAKRRHWHAKVGDKAREFLGKHLIPVILGPKDRHYVIDHHHLARALHEEGVEGVLITVVANLKKLERDAFWFVLDNRGWTHPFDDHGRRRDYRDIPKSISELVDDPFRSLAGELRRVGGFAKETTPFSEFLWADFLRRRIKRKMVEHNFDQTLEEALGLAKSAEANYLPGWCGPIPQD
jgi:hypothetical protein